MTKLAAQQAAATAAANADIAAGKTAFYSELFGASGSPLWNNGGVGFGTSPPGPTTAAGVFSVSKSIYVAYVAQAQTLTATDRPYLNMTSGQDTANGATCAQDDVQTVDVCLTTLMGSGNAAHLNKFSYDSRHKQYHADHVATTSLAGKTRSQITTLYKTTFGLATGDISMSSATIAGGVIAKPTTLRTIAQQIMAGTLTGIRGLLNDSQWIPVHASTAYTDGSVITSPAPSDEFWNYDWGLWREPGTGDYWMAGSGGTVVWIKKDFSIGGLVFRVADGVGGEMGVQSIRTMQAIRSAYQRAGIPIRKRITWTPWS